MEQDKTWHLAESTLENDLTEAELMLWRSFYGFLRWQESCEQEANRLNLTGHELSILHVIRMKNRPNGT